MEPERKPARFNPTLDIALLKSVILSDLYNDKNTRDRWKPVAQRVNEVVATTRDDIQFTERGCKDRVKLLVTAFKKGTMQQLKALGTEEEYNEREQLLIDLIDLYDGKQGPNSRGSDQHDAMKQELLEYSADVRQEAMQSFSQTSVMESDLEGPPAKKRITSDLVTYLITSDYINYMREKDQAERTLREKELEIRKKELELQQQREDQRKEREKQQFEFEKNREEQRNQKETLMMNLLMKMADKFN